MPPRCRPGSSSRYRSAYGASSSSCPGRQNGRCRPGCEELTGTVRSTASACQTSRLGLGVGARRGDAQRPDPRVGVGVALEQHRALAVGLAAELGLADQRPPLQVDVLPGLLLQPGDLVQVARDRASARSATWRRAGSSASARHTSATSAWRSARSASGAHSSATSPASREVGLDHRAGGLARRAHGGHARAATSAAVASPVTSMSHTVATATRARDRRSAAARRRATGCPAARRRGARSRRSGRRR